MGRFHWLAHRLGRLLPWLRQRQAEQDIQRELDLHLDLETGQNIEAGMSLDEARREARRSLGNRPLIREDARAVWSWRWLDVLRREGRYVFRGLCRRPGFSVLVIGILALGIGTTTAMFSVVHGVLLAPLPFREPAQLVTVQVTVRELQDQVPVLPVNYRSLVAWQNCHDTCAAVGALEAEPWALTGNGDPVELRGARVSGNFFTLLGVSPALGRLFRESGTGSTGGDGVVLTHALWDGVYGRDPQIVGRRITLDDEQVEVIGILPAAFWLPRFDTLYPLPIQYGTIELFRPLRYTSEEAGRPAEFNFPVIVRMATRASPDQVQAELAALTNASYQDLPLSVAPIVRPLDEQIIGSVRSSLWGLFAAVGVVFFIVCVNVASLLSAHWLGRRQELSVRSALGARMGHLVGQAFTESAVLAVAGGLLGMGVAQGFLQLVMTVAPVAIPRLHDAAIDGRVLAFASALTGLCAVLCGLLPAWRASRSQPQAALPVTTRTTQHDLSIRRVGDLLVGAEVALTVIVLALGGLLVVSFVRVLGVDRGFEVRQVVAADLTLPPTRYATPERRTQFYDGLLAALDAVPGVEAAGMSQRLPLEGVSSVNALVPVGFTGTTDYEVPTGNYRLVSPDYLRTMGIVVKQGRGFREQDRGQRVALVTESTADRLWPGQDPVGQRFHRGTPDRPAQTVIGLVGNARILGLEADPGLVAYLPYWEAPPGAAALVVRSTRDPLSIVASVREAVGAADPQLPLANIRLMEDVLSESVGTRRFLAQLTTGFASAGLLLVCFGIVGVVSGGVERRRHEFAVRVALGATKTHIVRLVLGGGLRPVIVGLMLGLASAFVLGRFVNALLFGVTASEPAIFAAVAVLVASLGVGACLVPGLRATQAAPAQMLRAE
jgi:putative ABC transport system permease protein